jgi:hypothetical protein
MNYNSTYPDIVIRPSGVWDTRAPLFQYIVHHRSENQLYYALVLGISRLIYDARDFEPHESASQFFQPKQTGRMAKRAWASYRNSFPQIEDGHRPEPTVQHALISLNSTLPSVTEYAIVSYCGLFETYIQCWALNYLLAKLECADRWTPQESRLASRFSPLSSTPLPSFYQICDGIPIIKEELRQVPHVLADPTTGKTIDAPILPHLNAYETVSFWRDWRNLLVHGSGIVNSRFHNRHAEFWCEFKQVFPHIPDFRIGKRLSLNDGTFRALTTAHYRAARALRNVLVDASGSRRGHVRAPGPTSESGRVSPEEVPDRPPPMLMYGDHEPSYRWTIDANFRQDFQKYRDESTPSAC